MRYIINHPRFKKKYDNNLKISEKLTGSKINKFPIYDKNYFDFFTNYASHNYRLNKNPCLCGIENDILLSETDRHYVNFNIVVCKNCGLIRAEKYFREEDVIDFYKNFYRTVHYSEKYKDEKPEDAFLKQKKGSKFKFDLIKKSSKYDLQNLKIVDLGGGAGGVLANFDENNEKYLFDFYDPYLDFAKTKGIYSVKGGLENIEFKPDIIILSHVIEHWSNFNKEIKKLISIQKENRTLNYIEFPGIDSIKKGRRDGDVLGDFHIPHVYYFTSYVFENLMNRYGFERVYIDSQIKSVFIFTGRKKNLINYYDKCRHDLFEGEKARKIQIIKNFIKLFLPSKIINLVSKVRNKKIKF